MNTTELKCPKCPKSFTSEQGLRMHTMRVHTGQIKTPGQLGVVKGERFQQPWSTKSKKRAATQVWTKDQIDLLFAIESKYRKGKNVDWKRAWDEHPEYVNDLGNRKEATIQQKLIYENAKKNTGRGRRNGSLVPTVIETRPVGRPRKLNAAPIAEEPNGKVYRVDFCPHCGEHVARWNYVAEVIQKLPK